MDLVPARCDSRGPEGLGISCALGTVSPSQCIDLNLSLEICANIPLRELLLKEEDAKVMMSGLMNL